MKPLFKEGPFFLLSKTPLLVLASCAALYGCGGDSEGSFPRAPSPTPKASPSAQPSSEPEATPTPEASATPETGETPEASPTPEATATPLTSETPEPSDTPEPSPTPEAGATPEPSETPEVSPTPIATQSPEPSDKTALDYKGTAAGICAPGIPVAELQQTLLDTELPAATLVVDGLKGAEGPVWVAAQNKLYFSQINRNAKAEGIERDDLLNSSISALDPSTGVVENWIEAAGSNGMALSPDGQSLYVAVTSKARIDQISLADPNDRIELVSQDVDGKPFNSTNDLVVSSTGNIYFTDPTWGSARTDGGSPAPFTTPAYWVNSLGEAKIFDDDLIQPNGISISPDEKTLYVAALKTGSADAEIPRKPEPYTYAYDLDGDGYPSNRRLLFSSPPDMPKTDGTDGTTVDCAGNLYTTASGAVIIISPEGDFVKKIPVLDEGYTSSNIAFGGADNNELFITVEQNSGPKAGRSYSIYKVAMPIKGMPY